jgi:hypothetical protein
MAVPEDYVSALVSYAIAINDVSPLEDMRDDLFSRISNGEAGALITSSVNGKNFGFSMNSISIEEKFAAVCRAIGLFNRKIQNTTYGQFSDIRR